MCSFAKKYVDDADECKDIVHNVFLNLWQKREEIHTDSSLKSYLFRSAHNRCLNHIRDSKKIVSHELPVDERLVQDFIDSNDYLEQSELEMKVKKSIDQLPEKCRRVFVLSRFHDKKYSEIAAELNVSVKAVEAQMTKALKILREQLIDYLILLMFFTISFIGL